MGWFDRYKIGTDDLKLLQTLGMYCWDGKKCDWSPQKFVEQDAQVTADTKDPTSYKLAYYALARLGGIPNVIESFDMKALAENDKKLAELMLQDPMVRFIRSGDALEFKKREIAGVMPPRHFKRFAAYVQMGLNRIFAKEITAGNMSKLEVNGVYGDAMKKAVAEFQARAGVEIPAGQKPGELLGRQTVGLLVVKLGDSKEDVLRKLGGAKATLIARSTRSLPAYIRMDAKQPDAMFASVQENVFLALKWLGYISPYADLGNSLDRQEAAFAIVDKFSDGKGQGPKLVGAEVVNRIMDRILASKI